MANFSALKTAIQNAIKQNGNEEITGDVLQQILLSIVNTMGDGAINTIEQNLSSETLARQGADNTLQQNIDAEELARGNADTQLQNAINVIKANINNGYVYAGIATPSTNPVSGKVFYIATAAGTYTNFGGQVLTQGINILRYNGSAWSNQQLIGIDDVPTAGSNGLVKSGGVQNELALGSVYDVSAKNPTGGPNNDGKWESLSALLSDANLDTLIPTAYRKGGMSIKYVCSSDNKYVQFRCMAQNFTTDVSQWQGVDDEPTAGSDNLVKSGGVNESLQKQIVALSAITENKVTSGDKNVFLESTFTTFGGNRSRVSLDVTDKLYYIKLSVASGSPYKYAVQSRLYVSSTSISDLYNDTGWITAGKSVIVTSYNHNKTSVVGEVSGLVILGTTNAGTAIVPDYATMMQYIEVSVIVYNNKIKTPLLENTENIFNFIQSGFEGKAVVGFIDSNNKWITNFPQRKHVLLRVQPNSSVKVQAYLTQNAGIAYLKSFDVTVLKNGDSPDFCDGTQLISISRGQTYEAVAPVDCVYLYIQSRAEDVIVFPSLLEVGGTRYYYDAAGDFVYNALVRNTVLNTGVIASDFVSLNGNSYIRYSDGKNVSSANMRCYVLKNYGFKKIFVNNCTSIDTVPASIAFFNGYPSIATYMQNDSLQIQEGTQSYNSEIPAECEYIIVSTRYANPLMSITISYDKSLQERINAVKTIEGLETKASETEIPKELIGSIDSNSKWSLGNSSLKYSIIPVKEGDIVKIQRSGGFNAIIAFLKTNKIPADGQVIDSSDTYSGRITLSDLDIVTTYIVPSDTHYIYVFVANGDAIWTPARFTVNGYEVFKSNKEQISELNLAKKISSVAYNPFRYKPFYYHLFLDTQSDTGVIPSQSIWDVQVAARLGFEVMEFNPAPTSDGYYVCIHGGVNGNGELVLGPQMKTIQGESASDVVISEHTLEDLQTNYVYRSKYQKYQTRLEELDVVLRECLKYHIKPLIKHVDDSITNRIIAICGDDYISYNGNRVYDESMIMQYSGYELRNQLLSLVQKTQKPLLYLMDSSSIVNRSEETIRNYSNDCHSFGALLGAACLLAGEVGVQKCLNNGVDVFASYWNVNDFSDGNLCNKHSDIDFSEFVTDGTVSNGILSLSNGQTVSVTGLGTHFLSKGALHLMYNGTLSVKLSHKNAENITSDGKKDMFFSSYMMERENTFLLTAVGDVQIFNINYVASKC